MAMTIHERNIFPSSGPTAALACTRFHLPASGILVLDGSITTTLTAMATFQPLCTNPASLVTNINATDPDALLVDLPNPFYASASPQFYAMATATVISWMLVIMLLITPRTFFIGGPGGGRFLGRRNFITGGLESAGIVGVGGRPWLQKVATLLVAISLTLTSIKIFNVTYDQYLQGFQDAQAISDQIGDSWSIKILSIISKTFLWLAQVQTLIRLFPRHKEKVSIKWLGFALIVLDFVFAVLQNVVIPDAGDSGTDDDSTDGALSVPQRKSFTQAIPAVSYLFSLSLSLLYAAAVMYYSLEKRRYAFFHPKMRNICLVALISLLAISIPIVFFVLDIANPQIANWGDYIRWVGAASASVVVWEWVERIEALERDERRHGILGREVFDGDDMLDPTPSKEVCWPSSSETLARSRSDSPGHPPSAHLPHVGRRHGQTSPRSNYALDSRLLATTAPDHGSLIASRSAPPALSASPSVRADATTLDGSGTESGIGNETTSLSAVPAHEDSLSTIISPVDSPINLATADEHTTPAALLTTAVQSPTNATTQDRPDVSNTPVLPSALRSRLPFRLPFTFPSLSTHQSSRRPSGLPSAISRAFATSSQDTPREAVSGLATTTAASEDNEERIRPSILGRFHVRRNSRPSNVALPVVVVPMQPRGMIWTPPIDGDAGRARQAGASASDEE